MLVLISDLIDLIGSGGFMGLVMFVVIMILGILLVSYIERNVKKGEKS